MPKTTNAIENAPKAPALTDRAMSTERRMLLRADRAWSIKLQLTARSSRTRRPATRSSFPRASEYLEAKEQDNVDIPGARAVPRTLTAGVSVAEAQVVRCITPPPPAVGPSTLADSQDLPIRSTGPGRPSN